MKKFLFGFIFILFFSLCTENSLFMNCYPAHAKDQIKLCTEVSTNSDIFLESTTTDDDSKLNPTAFIVPPPPPLICCEYPGYNLSTDLTGEFTSTNIDIMEMSVPTERFMETEEDCINGTGRRNRSGRVVPNSACGALCLNIPNRARCNTCCDVIYPIQNPTDRSVCRGSCLVLDLIRQSHEVVQCTGSIEEDRFCRCPGVTFPEGVRCTCSFNPNDSEIGEYIGNTCYLPLDDSGSTNIPNTETTTTESSQSQLEEIQIINPGIAGEAFIYEPTRSTSTNSDTLPESTITTESPITSESTTTAEIIPTQEITNDFTAVLSPPIRVCCEYNYSPLPYPPSSQIGFPDDFTNLDIPSGSETVRVISLMPREYCTGTDRRVVDYGLCNEDGLIRPAPFTDCDQTAFPQCSEGSCPEGQTCQSIGDTCLCETLPPPTPTTTEPISNTQSTENTKTISQESTSTALTTETQPGLSDSLGSSPGTGNASCVTNADCLQGLICINSECVLSAIDLTTEQPTEPTITPAPSITPESLPTIETSTETTLSTDTTVTPPVENNPIEPASTTTTTEQPAETPNSTIIPEIQPTTNTENLQPDNSETTPEPTEDLFAICPLDSSDCLIGTEEEGEFYTSSRSTLYVEQKPFKDFTDEEKDAIFKEIIDHIKATAKPLKDILIEQVKKPEVKVLLIGEYHIAELDTFRNKLATLFASLKNEGLTHLLIEQPKKRQTIIDNTDFTRSEEEIKPQLLGKIYVDFIPLVIAAKKAGLKVNCIDTDVVALDDDLYKFIPRKLREDTIEENVINISKATTNFKALIYYGNSHTAKKPVQSFDGKYLSPLGERLVNQFGNNAVISFHTFINSLNFDRRIALSQKPMLEDILPKLQDWLKDKTNFDVIVVPIAEPAFKNFYNDYAIFQTKTAILPGTGSTHSPSTEPTLAPEPSPGTITTTETQSTTTTETQPGLSDSLGSSPGTGNASCVTNADCLQGLICINSECVLSAIDLTTEQPTEPTITPAPSITPESLPTIETSTETTLSTDTTVTPPVENNPIEPASTTTTTEQPAETPNSTIIPEIQPTTNTENLQPDNSETTPEPTASSLAETEPTQELTPTLNTNDNPVNVYTATTNVCEEINCPEGFKCFDDGSGTPQCIHEPDDVPDDAPISPLQAALGFESNNSCLLPADLTVKLDDGVEESIFNRGATIETLSASCPYLSSPQVEPPNITRHIDVFDLSSNCAQCSSFVKDLIYAYYDGDPSAGSSLCSLPPEELNNCVVLEARDQAIHYQPVPPELEPWLEIINTVLSPITDAQNRETYNMQGYISLTINERDSLLKRWPQATTKYYAATWQHLFAYAGWFPRDLTLMFPPVPPQAGGNGNWVRVRYNNRADLLAAMISPAQALTDYENAITMGTNFWPDIAGIDGPIDPVNEVFGRRNAGSLNYEFMVASVQNGPPSNRTYKPYYHANFVDPFPLFLFSRLINSSGNLSDAFQNTLNNWVAHLGKAFQPPMPIQIPSSPSWGVPPNPASPVYRFAIIIKGTVQGENNQPPLFSFISDIAQALGIIQGPDPEAERFIKEKTVAYIEHILRNRLNYPANNVAIYDVSGDTLPDVMALQTKINATLTTARTLRTNNPNAKIELAFYFHGHGRSIRPEQVMAGQQPINNAWFKEGGLEHEFWLGGNNSLFEGTLKDFANGYVKSNDNPTVNDRIFDRIDFIDGSCESGAGVY